MTIPQRANSVKDPELKEIVANGRKRLNKTLLDSAKRIDAIITNSNKQFTDLQEFLAAMMQFENPSTENKHKGRLEKIILDFFVKYQEIYDYGDEIKRFISITGKGKIDNVYTIEYYSLNSNYIAIYSINKKLKQITMQKIKKPESFSGRGHRNRKTRY